MNKGCFWYLKNGFINAYEGIIKNIGNYFKYYAFMLAYILSAILIFPFPIFSLANMKISQMISEQKDIKLLKAFEDVDQSKRYTKYLFVFIIYLFMFIGIALLISLFFGLCILLVNCIPHAKTIKVGTIILLIIYIAITILFEIYANFYFTPTALLILKRPQKKASEVLQDSIIVMEGRKFSLFCIHILIELILLAIGLVSFGFFTLFQHLKTQSQVAPSGLMIILGLAVIFMILLFLVLPYFVLVVQSAQYLLINDGINPNLEIEASTHKKDLTSDELLDLLFEEAGEK